MIVNGEVYKTDLIIFPDEVLPNWWRKSGHSLCKEDLKEILNNKPDILVVGRGALGMMQVPDNIEKELQERDIEVIAKKTSEAVKVFNAMIEKGRKVAGGFHLTC